MVGRAEFYIGSTLGVPNISKYNVKPIVLISMESG